MNKLMLEALAAWLALAMASGQAAAAISATGAQIDSLPTIVSHGNGISDDARFAVPPLLSNGEGYPRIRRSARHRIHYFSSRFPGPRPRA